MKRLSLLLCLLLCLSPLAAPARGEEALPALPQLERVHFDGCQPLPPEGAAPYAPHEEAYAADGQSYHDDTLDIQVHRLRAFDTPLFIAFVQIADPSQLRTALARPHPSQATARTNVIGKRANAVLAVNGDWFGFHNAGIIYRQGELLRSRPNAEYDALIIDRRGDFHLVCPLTEEGFQAACGGETPLHSFCFGPALVRDGEIVDNADRAVTYKQRMAIGQIDALSYVLVCCDGPEERDSVGLSIPQLSRILQAVGARQAYNLDGGQSTYMYFNGTKVNGQKEGKGRAVGDIVYFATGKE